MQKIIAAIGEVISEVRPETLFVPWRYDVHTDHRAVFDAVTAYSKSFRYPSIRTVLAYETPSETDFSLLPASEAFHPNLWIDISEDLDAKLGMLACYPSEIGAFPFPRSEEVITALARLRGSTAGVEAAEAFQLLKGIV